MEPTFEQKILLLIQGHNLLVQQFRHVQLTQNNQVEYKDILKRLILILNSLQVLIKYVPDH
jgi:hypothetical protein